MKVPPGLTGMNYAFFSHFVTANAPALGVEPAKQLLYAEAS